MINRHRLTPTEAEEIIKNMQEHEDAQEHENMQKHKHKKEEKRSFSDDTGAHGSPCPNDNFSDENVSDANFVASDGNITKEENPPKKRKKQKKPQKKNMFSFDSGEEDDDKKTVSYEPVITSVPDIRQTETEAQTPLEKGEIKTESAAKAVFETEKDVTERSDDKKVCEPKNADSENTVIKASEEQKKIIKPSSDTSSVEGADEFIAELKKIKDRKEPEIPDKKKLSLKTKDKLRYAFIVVCIAVFIVSVLMISIGFASGKSAKSLYSELQSDFLDGLNINSETPASPNVVRSIATPPFGAERNNESNLLLSPNNELYSQIKAKLTSYKNTNQDIYGWITIEGTNINYVVLKGDDNSYYLDHTYNKSYNPLGAIFVDFRCLGNAIDNKNLVIYGHFASYYKQMFYDISKFLDKEFFDKNKTITLYTLDGVLTYEIFAIYETDATYHYVNPYFATDQEFEAWANEVKSKSLYVRDTEPLNVSDRIITLSTCTNGLASRRYALQARLVNVEY